MAYKIVKRIRRIDGIKQRYHYNASPFPFKQPKKTETIPGNDYVAQTKYDGERVHLVDKGDSLDIWNRRGVNKKAQFPELQIIAKYLKGKNIIDGELIVKNKKGQDDFKLLAQRSHLKDKEEILALSHKTPAQVIAFDILQRKGVDVRKRPWYERDKLMRQIKESKHLKHVKNHPPSQTPMILRDKSVEGVIFKQKGSAYNNRKNASWLKKKQIQEAHLVVTAFNEGKGKRKNMIGALYGGIAKNHKIKEITKVGTGFSDDEGRRLFKELNAIKIKKEGDKIIVKPKTFIAVNYLKLGTKGALREPSYKGERDDITLANTHI